MSVSNKIKSWFTEIETLELGVMAVVFFVISTVSVSLWLLCDSLCILGNLILLVGLSLLAGLVTSVIYLICLLFRVVKWNSLSEKEKVLNFIILVMLIGLNFFFFFAKGVLRIQNIEMRLYVGMTGGVEELKEWAESILEKVPEDVLANPENPSMGWLKKDMYSEQVKKIRPRRVSLRQRNELKYLVISIQGGGFLETDKGIVIYSEPSLADTSNASLFKWSDSVYAYFGRSP